MAWNSWELSCLSPQNANIRSMPHHIRPHTTIILQVIFGIMIPKTQKNHILFRSQVLSSDYSFFSGLARKGFPVKTSRVFMWGEFLWTVRFFDVKMIILLGYTGSVFLRMMQFWFENNKSLINPTVHPQSHFLSSFSVPKRNPISFAWLMCLHEAQAFLR